MARNLIRGSLLVAVGSLAVGCAEIEDADPEAGDDTSSEVVASGVWQDFTTDGNTLTLRSSEPLRVSSPFFGIAVHKNGEDITDDIEAMTTLSATSWRYTFGTEILDTPGDVIEISLDNRKLATPGHYVALRAGGVGDTVQEMQQLLQQCEAGTGACAGDPPRPGLVAAVKGMSRRYMPRDLEVAEGVYDFSPIFEDAVYLASVGKRLHVIFTIKSFATDSLFNGNGVTKSFPVPAAWDRDRRREIHVYVNNEEVSFTLDATRTHVLLASAPPAGTKNVNVVYARDPFPEYAWHLSPPIGGWYVGVGGPHTGPGGSHGFVHAPWRSTCVGWMRDFMAAFRDEWTAAIVDDPSLASAIESISVQETANSLGGPGYTEQAYRDGLLEYAKFNARAVRGRAVFGQLLNHIPGGNATGALQKHALAIIPWGARLEGPDLFNDEPSLEDKVYEQVHRALHDQTLTMIWQQNASYREPVGDGFYTPAQQFEKARRGITDTQTPSGTPGLEAEYVFWNMTQNNGVGYSWKDALPVIAANPVIQPTGNNRNRWRRTDYTAIPNQSLQRVNP